MIDLLRFVEGLSRFVVVRGALPPDPEAQNSMLAVHPVSGGSTALGARPGLLKNLSDPI